MPVPLLTFSMLEYNKARIAPMPTIFTHALVPLLPGAAAESRRIPHRLLTAGVVAAMLPDADVLAFHLHIPYADAFGHRGATHSACFALACAAIAALGHRWLGASRRLAASFVGLSALSHPLLDACTDGGLGVALWWPWNDARWFAPWRPIAVSPIGTRFFSARGWHVLASEALWVWLPTALVATGIVLWRRASRRP